MLIHPVLDTRTFCVLPNSLQGHTNVTEALQKNMV